MARYEIPELARINAEINAMDEAAADASRKSQH